MKKKIFVFAKCFLLIIVIISTNIVKASGFSEINNLDKDNVFKLLVGDAQTDAKFDLRNLIPENIIVRNQGSANNCWDFAAIGAFETTLALKRKKNNSSVKIFDFSEAHVKYGSRYSMFLNGKKNIKGYDATKYEGGNFTDVVNYMTNGFGPVDERWLRYNENEPNIDLSSIESITQSATVMNTVDFSIPNNKINDNAEIENAISKIKSHIKNYGGVYFALNYYPNDQYINTSNMARYCNVPLMNDESASHAVVLIGWDDNYSASNFKINPGKNGAWIFKNSYGNYSKVEYLSYYDKTSYTGTYGFQDVEEGKNYDYQYQHQVLPPMIDFHVTKGPVINQLSVAEVYSRDSSKTDEKVTRLSIEASRSGEYEFYINPNNDSLTNLIPVSVNKTYLTKGFNTVKLNTPVSLTGSKFVIAAKIPIDNNEFHMIYEPRNTVSGYTGSVSLSGETYVNYVDNNNSSYWYDFVDRGRGNSSLKAYSNVSSHTAYPTKIKMLSEPNKLEYIKDLENLDVTGGKILVSMSNGETVTKDLSDRNVKLSGFSNSTLGPKNITVDYMNNKTSFTVNIIDSPNQLVSLKLKKSPNKVEYMVNEVLQRDGGILEASYSDGRILEIDTSSSSVNFSSPNMSVPGTKTVTITYGGKSVNYSILVKERPVTLNKIDILRLPTKINYIQNIENLDLTGGEIRATFSNNNVLDIQMNSNDVIVSGFDNSKIGKNTLTINYRGKEVNFDVNIIEKPKVVINDASILKKPNKLKYKKGEPLDLSGGTITLIYSDGTNKVIGMDDTDLVQYSNFNPNLLGVQIVELRIKDFNRVLNINVEVVNNDPVIDQNKVIENQIISNQIISNQIEQNKILENQIISNQIISNQIEQNKILENQIISNQIISNQIEQNKILENQIISNQIISNQIEQNKILENQIISNKINANQVEQNKILENQIISNRIIANQIENNRIIENQIISNQIIQNQIQENKVSENKTTENKVTENKVTENKTTENKVSENKTDNNDVNNGDKKDYEAFKDTVAEIVDSSNFVYTDSNKNYVEIEINVTNIDIDDSKDYNVKYYLSGNSGDVISDDKYVFISKLNKQKDGKYSAKFKINSKDLNNLSDIMNSDRLYLYLRAENGSNVSKSVVSLKNVSNLKNYINDKRVDKIDKETLNKYKDNTVKNKTLPQTGALPGLAIVSSLIIIVGAIAYFKYKNINK